VRFLDVTNRGNILLYALVRFSEGCPGPEVPGFRRVAGPQRLKVG